MEIKGPLLSFSVSINAYNILNLYMKLLEIPRSCQKEQEQ